MEDQTVLKIVYDSDCYEIIYLGLSLRTEKLQTKIKVAVEWLIENGYTSNPNVRNAIQNRVAALY